MKQRMYVLVPYNLSPIQKGIQALHAVVEYGNLYSNTVEYKQWAEKDKTVILLNGGTSNCSLLSDSDKKPFHIFKGTLNNYEFELRNKGYKIASFCEEDINNALTGVAILADERIWDRETYPNFDKIDNGVYLKTGKFIDDEHKASYDKWVETIGGSMNVFLREFLISKPLAN